MKIALSVFLIVLLDSGLTQTPEKDLVNHFPTWPEYTFKVYSGQLQLTNPNFTIHYIFVESQKEPQKDPVVLWLNGGPGCSSVLGFSQEIGPFYLPDGGAKTFSQKLNEYSWNKDANLLFFESPPGVGFSNNLDPNNLTFTDDEVADLNHEALALWFNRFESYKNREFWITGESYAGMYIPYLAKKIINSKETTPFINLTGIMIGNGLLQWDEKQYTFRLLDYLHNYMIINNELHNQIKEACNIGSIKCTWVLDEAAKLYRKMTIYDMYGYCYYDENFFGKMQEKLKFPGFFLRVNFFPIITKFSCRIQQNS